MANSKPKLSTQPKNETVNSSPKPIIGMMAPTVTTGPRKIVLTVGGELLLEVDLQNGKVHAIRGQAQYDTEDALRLAIAECNCMLKWIQETLDGLPTDPNDKRLLTATTNEKYRKIIALTNNGYSPSQIASLTGLVREQISLDKGRIKKKPKLAPLMIGGEKSPK